MGLTKISSLNSEYIFQRPKFGNGHVSVSSMKDLLYIKFEASNWKLRDCSRGRWCEHFISAMQFPRQLVEFSLPVATLLLN
jgi:hypothetical protein